MTVLHEVAAVVDLADDVVRLPLVVRRDRRRRPRLGAVAPGEVVEHVADAVVGDPATTMPVSSLPSSLVTAGSMATTMTASSSW